MRRWTRRETTAGVSPLPTQSTPRLTKISFLSSVASDVCGSDKGVCAGDVWVNSGGVPGEEAVGIWYVCFLCSCGWVGVMVNSNDGWCWCVPCVSWASGGEHRRSLLAAQPSARRCSFCIPVRSTHPALLLLLLLLFIPTKRTSGLIHPFHVRTHSH